ncbi:MAG: universal stress protein [Acidobacteriia bacterium]|nr:universal stress protein [Terriglobia bacterium]
MKTIELTTQIAMKNILFATDFSPASEAPLACAEAFARHYDSKLYLVHVIAPGADQEGAARTPPIPIEQTCHPVQERMSELSRSKGLQGIPHESIIREGDIADTLSDIVRNWGIDLAVLGTHGRHEVQKFVLGSVAEAIFRRATCPVLTVGPRACGNAGGKMKLRRILFGTDLTPTSLAALPLALSLAQEHQAQLTLLWLVHPEIQSPSERHRIKTGYETQLQNLVPEETKRWCQVEAVVNFGLAAEGILQFADRQQTDLIVLGVRGLGVFDWAASHIPSPTAYVVAAQATCPVMTVHDFQTPLNASSESL